MTEEKIQNVLERYFNDNIELVKVEFKDLRVYYIEIKLKNLNKVIISIYRWDAHYSENANIHSIILELEYNILNLYRRK